MTHDEKLGRWLKWGGVCVLLCLVWLVAVDARELAEIVEPSELSSDWDGRRVTIFGYAKDCEFYRGRLNSNYVKCMVEGVAVYMDFMVYGILGEEVIAIGVYREHGRFGGLIADHFIIADTFIRDWGN